MDRGLYIQKIIAGGHMLDTKINIIMLATMDGIPMKSIYASR